MGKSSWDRIYGRIFSAGALTVLAAAIGIYNMVAAWGDVHAADSNSYVQAWGQMLGGQPMISRTPVSAAFFGICHAVGSTTGDSVAAVISTIAWVLTIPVMWRIVRDMGCGRLITFLIVASLGVANPMLWINLVFGLTDILALCGMTVFCRQLQLLCIDPRPKRAVWVTVTMILLVFLRPALVYLLPVAALFFGIKAFGKKRRSIWLSALGGTLLTWGMILGWSAMVYRASGVFSPTVISVVNHWISARGQHLVDTHHIPDDETGRKLKAMIAANDPKMNIKMEWQQFKLALDEIDVYVDAYGPQGYGRLNEILKHGAAENPRRELAAVKHRWEESLDYSLSLFTLNQIHIFMLLFLVVIALYWIRRRQFPWFAALMLALAASHIIVSIIGAPNDWDRLTLPAIAPLLGMAGATGALFAYRGVPPPKTT